MLKKMVDNMANLKKYFSLSVFHKEIPKAELLSSNEALKNFGKLWGENAGDVMMMLAVVEYEYTTKGGYTEEEIVAVKNSLASVAQFLKGCTKEWQAYEATQKRNKDH